MPSYQATLLAPLPLTPSFSLLPSRRLLNLSFLFLLLVLLSHHHPSAEPLALTAGGAGGVASLIHPHTLLFRLHLVTLRPSAVLALNITFFIQ